MAQLKTLANNILKWSPTSTSKACLQRAKRECSLIDLTRKQELFELFITFLHPKAISPFSQAFFSSSDGREHLSTLFLYRDYDAGTYRFYRKIGHDLEIEFNPIPALDLHKKTQLHPQLLGTIEDSFSSDESRPTIGDPTVGIITTLLNSQRSLCIKSYSFCCFNASLFWTS